MKTITSTENNTQDLLSCIMQNKADQAIAILESGDYDKDILKDVGAFINPLPLYQLTVCQAILLGDDDWDKNVVPTVERNRQECDKLLKYWADKFHYPVGDEINFMSYEDEFERSSTPLEEVFGRTLDELESLGYNRDEVLLCYGVLTHDSIILKEQLRKKTNPDVYIPVKTVANLGAKGEDAWNHAIYSCETHISHIFDDLSFIMFWEPNDDLIYVHPEYISSLVEAAAYTRLLKELKNLTSKK